MRTRTLYGALMIAGVAAIVGIDVFARIRILVPLLMLGLAIAGWLEYARIVGISGTGPKRHPGLRLLGLASIGWFFAVAWSTGGTTAGLPGRPETWTILGIAATVLAAHLLVIFRSDFEALYAALLECIAGALLFGFLFSYLVQVYMLPGREGPVLWAVLVAGVKGNDVAAYYVGKTWGRRHFLKISPKKTLEGSLGAIAFSVAWFGAAGALLGEVLPKCPFGWPGGMLFGMIVSAASQAGDLAESLVKRVYQVKDSSALLPEFGGVLDMIDSLVFAGILLWGIH